MKVTFASTKSLIAFLVNSDVLCVLEKVGKLVDELDLFAKGGYFTALESKVRAQKLDVGASLYN